MIAEKEYLAVIQAEGLLPGLGPEVVPGQSTENKFVGRSGQPTGDPMAIAANVFPDMERGIHQGMRLYSVHLGIGESNVPAHLAQKCGMAGADLVLHHQFLTNLANRLSDYLEVLTVAHPGRTQHRA